MTAIPAGIELGTIIAEAQWNAKLQSIIDKAKGKAILFANNYITKAIEEGIIDPSKISEEDLAQAIRIFIDELHSQYLLEQNGVKAANPNNAVIDFEKRLKARDE